MEGKRHGVTRDNQAKSHPGNGEGYDRQGVQAPGLGSAPGYRGIPDTIDHHCTGTSLNMRSYSFTTGMKWSISPMTAYQSDRSSRKISELWQAGPIGVNKATGQHRESSEDQFETWTSRQVRKPELTKKVPIHGWVIDK
jgi:hypothetical protein